MTTLDLEFRRVISAYLEHSGIKGKELGERALGEPGFVTGLKRGASPQLDVADRMLRFMDIAPIGPRFRHEVEAFLIAARVRTRADRSGNEGGRRLLVRAGSEKRGIADAGQRRAREIVDARLRRRVRTHRHRVAAGERHQGPALRPAGGFPAMDRRR